MMKKVRTTLILLLAMTMLAMSLSACGSSSSENTGGTKPTGGGSSEEWDETMECYQKFLSRETIQWTGGEEIMVTEEFQFFVEDITGDGIPELFVKLPYYCYGWVGIFTRVSGVAEDIAYCDEPGGYYPGTGVYTVVSNVDYQGNPIEKTTESYKYLKDLSQYSSGVVKGQTSVGDTETKDGATQYYWSGVYNADAPNDWEEVSQEEFESELQTLTNGVEKVQIPTNWQYNTEENRDQYLK